MMKGKVIVSKVKEMKVGEKNMEKEKWKLMIYGRKGEEKKMKNCILKWREKK
jgi:hypothetical protein